MESSPSQVIHFQRMKEILTLNCSVGVRGIEPRYDTYFQTLITIINFINSKHSLTMKKLLQPVTPSMSYCAKVQAITRVTSSTLTMPSRLASNAATPNSSRLTGLPRM